MQSDKHDRGGCHDSSEEKLGQPCSPWRDQSWLHGGHPQAHKGRCVPALMIGLTALVLCFLGGNQRVSNLVTILKLVWLKWLVGTHTTAMATDTYTFFFGS